MSMSSAANPRVGAPERRGGEEQERSHIGAVQATRARRPHPPLLYALVSIVGISAVACAQLLLTIGTSQGAYDIAALQQEQKELVRTAEAVREDVARVKSSQNLAANAEALGMVRNSHPVYLRLSDGAVLGSPIPATRDAGTVIGDAGSNVPNSLLDGVPLVTQLPPDVKVGGLSDD